MTNLKIIPNFEKKTAKFEGVIAAGEKIHATIENVGGFIVSTQNLRLRVVGSDGGTLAGFPQENELGEVVENWSFGGDTIECDLNLNTVQILEAVPPAAKVMVLFVLDNPEDETLYFKSFCTVDHWPRRVGEEEPVDLGGYADFVQDAKQSIASAEEAIDKASANAQSAAERAGKAESNAKAAQEAATGAVGSAATYAYEAKKARDEAKGYAEAAANTPANAATKAELQAEVSRAKDAEAALADAIGKEVTRAKLAEETLSKTALLALYYPEGNVTSLDEITTEGLTYSYNETDLTATVISGLHTIKDIVIPWRVTKDGKYYTVVEIGSQAFLNPSVDVEHTSLIVPTTVTVIRQGAFALCYNLVDISIPSVKRIESGAFEQCAVKKVSLRSCSFIGSGAFLGCNNLKLVDFGATPLDAVPTLEDSSVFYTGTSTPTIVVPLGMYSKWVATSPWNDDQELLDKIVGYASSSDVSTVLGFVDTRVADAIAVHVTKPARMWFGVRTNYDEALGCDIVVLSELLKYSRGGVSYAEVECVGGLLIMDDITFGDAALQVGKNGFTFGSVMIAPASLPMLRISHIVPYNQGDREMQHIYQIDVIGDSFV